MYGFCIDYERMYRYINCIKSILTTGIMSDSKKTNNQKISLMNDDSPQTLEKCKTDPQNVPKHMNGIKMIRRFNNIRENDSDVSEKMNIVEDEEMLDFIAQVNKCALNFIPKLTEMIDNKEMTFAEVEKKCSSHVKKLMEKTFDNNTKQQNEKFNKKLLQEHELNIREKYYDVTKKISLFNDVVTNHKHQRVEIGPHVKPFKFVRTVGTQCDLISNNSPPKHNKLQSDKSQNSTDTGSGLQGVNLESASCLNVIDISSEEEDNVITIT